MKFAAAILLTIGLALTLSGSEVTVIPAEPSIKEIAKKAESATVVLTCQPNDDQSGLEVIEVLKGEEAYRKNRVAISRLIPKSDPKALATKGFRELVFIGPTTKEGEFASASTFALWPARIEDDGVHRFEYGAHDYAEVKRAVRGKDKEAQQGGPGAPATNPKSESQGNDKSQPKSEGRSQ